MESALDKMNVRRLITKLKVDLWNFLDHNLFEQNLTSKAVKNYMDPYLKSLVDKQAIYDYNVVTRHARWEDYYPDMPTRLLAIKACELFGSRLEATPENIEMVQDYPYRIEDHYYDPETNEYLGSSHDIEVDVEDCTIVSSELVIDDPAYKIFVDMLIKPMHTVEFIHLNIRTIDGVFQNVD